MKKSITLALLSVIFCLPSYGQTIIGGTTMPNVVKVGNEYLKINGGGVREKMFISLYVCALYLPTKSSNAEEIIKEDGVMGVKIKIVSGMVDNENFEKALRDGFNKATNNNIEPIKERMEIMMSEGLKDDIKTGDVYDLIYEPSKGCTLIKNNISLVTVKGLDFKKALFAIWLGNQPANENLKNKMLGK